MRTTVTAPIIIPGTADTTMDAATTITVEEAITMVATGTEGIITATGKTRRNIRGEVFARV